MFNIIFPIIIFVSLAIIVFIIGKHLPEFIDVKKSDEKSPIKKNFLKNFLKSFLGIIKNSLIWLIEKIIEKTKNLLTLIHSWIVDVRKGKKENDLTGEDPKNTENSKQDNFLDQITKKDKTESSDLNNGLKKREDFFNKKEKPDQERVGFFGKFKSNLKEKLLEKRRKKIDQVFQEEETQEDNQFSDGIVGIHEKPQNKEVEEEKLINEVIEVKKEKASSMNLDDEIGVDRHILEKKLINKIASNPKDKEIYRQLGELYLKMQNYSDAENCYKYILKINIRDIDAKRKIERINLLKRSRGTRKK